MQQSMLLEGSYLSGGPSFGTFLLQGQMKNIQSLLLLILRSVSVINCILALTDIKFFGLWYFFLVRVM